MSIENVNDDVQLPPIYEVVHLMDSLENHSYYL